LVSSKSCNSDTLFETPVQDPTSIAKVRTQLQRWWLPHEPHITWRGSLLTGLGCFVGLLAVGAISRAVVGPEHALYIAAYMGAAAVLIFAAPHSPLSQPWPLLGGHVVAAFVGVTCRELIPDMLLASASAVALALVAMQALRCLHPPGGAAAMIAVVGGSDIHELGYWYVLVPVGLNALVLLALALVINNLMPDRRYPAKP
jgi:CBS domain-containing membrane protein